YSSTTVSISGVTIRNGQAPTGDTSFAFFSPDNSVGGGILNQGDLTITSSILTGNQATGNSNLDNEESVTAGNAFGGAIYNRDGTLTLSSSTISGNKATGGDANFVG